MVNGLVLDTTLNVPCTEVCDAELIDNILVIQLGLSGFDDIMRSPTLGITPIFTMGIFVIGVAKLFDVKNKRASTSPTVIQPNHPPWLFPFLKNMAEGFH